MCCFRHLRSRLRTQTSTVGPCWHHRTQRSSLATSHPSMRCTATWRTISPACWNTGPTASLLEMSSLSMYVFQPRLCWKEKLHLTFLAPQRLADLGYGWWWVLKTEEHMVWLFIHISKQDQPAWWRCVWLWFSMSQSKISQLDEDVCGYDFPCLKASWASLMKMWAYDFPCLKARSASLMKMCVALIFHVSKRVEPAWHTCVATIFSISKQVESIWYREGVCTWVQTSKGVVILSTWAKLFSFCRNGLKCPFYNKLTFHLQISVLWKKSHIITTLATKSLRTLDLLSSSVPLSCASRNGFLCSLSSIAKPGKLKLKYFRKLWTQASEILQCFCVVYEIQLIWIPGEKRIVIPTFKVKNKNCHSTVSGVGNQTYE